jgi:hypothetical protein
MARPVRRCSCNSSPSAAGWGRQAHRMRRAPPSENRGDNTPGRAAENAGCTTPNIGSGGSVRGGARRDNAERQFGASPLAGLSGGTVGAVECLSPSGCRQDAACSRHGDSSRRNEALPSRRSRTRALGVNGRRYGVVRGGSRRGSRAFQHRAAVVALIARRQRRQARRHARRSALFASLSRHRFAICVGGDEPMAEGERDGLGAAVHAELR